MPDARERWQKGYADPSPSLTQERVGAMAAALARRRLRGDGEPFWRVLAAADRIRPATKPTAGSKASAVYWYRCEQDAAACQKDLGQPGPALRRITPSGTTTETHVPTRDRRPLEQRRR